MSEQTTVCAEKHKNVDARLEGHDEHFIKLDIEVDTLKKAAVRSEVTVETVCKKIDQLITVLITATLALLGGALAFVVWYIQSIPR